MAYQMQRTPQLQKLHTYIKKNTSKFPKLLPALRALSEFVGHEDIKDAVAKMVLFFIAQCATVKPLRRSKRRRKPPSRNKRPRKRSRTFSTSDEEDEDYVPSEDPEPGEDSVAKMALIALLTHSLQAGVDSDDDEYEEEEEETDENKEEEEEKDKDTNKMRRRKTKSMIIKNKKKEKNQEETKAS